MSPSSTSNSERETGKWGRTPFRPDELREKFGTADSESRLSVTCPGCGNQFRPLATCCVKKGEPASPFCPECGVDFRADPDDVQQKRLFIAAADSEVADRLTSELSESEGVEIRDSRSIWEEE